MMRSRAILVFAMLAPFVATQLDAAELDPRVPMFVRDYCMRCHDAKQEKGDRSFEQFLASPSHTDHHETLAEILDLLNLGEMPPQKEGVKQPPDEERRKIVSAITGYLQAVTESTALTETQLRRLTRYEYDNTMRDLLGIHPEFIDATSDFPPDPDRHGFTNIGEVQVLSDHQLELYLAAASQYLDTALVFGREHPERRIWHFKPSDFERKKVADGQVAYRVLDQEEKFVDIGHGEPADRRPNAPPRFARTGVHSDGLYRIRVKATAIKRKDHPYDPSILGIDLVQRMKIGIWYATDKRFLEKSALQGRKLVAVFDLQDYESDEFEATVWMNKGAIPFFNWINGPGAAKGPVTRIMREYHPDGLRLGPTRIDELRSRGIEVTEAEIARRSKIHASDFYQGPRLRLFGMTLEGPLNDQWPPASHRKLVGATTNASEVDIPTVLTKCANEAFRRPVGQSEIQHYIDYTNNRIAEGADHAEAIKLGLSAILTSPRFLFLDEGDSANSAELDGYEVASRLSYMLWGSTPDARLLDAAALRTLGDPQVLRRQAERLLSDPRSEAFTQHFTDVWLRLDKLGSMPPGVKQFPLYYRRRLEAAMKTETHLFFSHLLRENRPITELITANYSFLNDSLALHYGMDDIEGEAFRKVSLPAHIRRGGLLGHASVLTATANGVETSPVVRGVWLLESILGTPPSPPPPDVPPIEPDTRGATTIREQLAKHRSVAACADCHSKIDPWGFALEFYDPIGALRTHYPVADGENQKRVRRGRKIDAAGQLPSGDQIDDESDLRQLLAKRGHQLTRNLVHKLLTYATGREVSFRDLDEVDRIVSTVAASGYGVKDLVLAITASDAFRRR